MRAIECGKRIGIGDKDEEASLSGTVEWMLKEATEAAAAGMEMPVSLQILAQDDIWICDTGASSNGTFSKKGAKNIRKNGSSSLGQAGKALDAELTIDVPGQFVCKDGTLGGKAVLHDCNFNEKMNFNLLSLSRLIFKLGWEITKGDHTGIVVEHKPSGAKINFDIVVPTPRGGGICLSVHQRC